MAKTSSSSLVFSIIFLVMFSLVEENMGCGQFIGKCDVLQDCRRACRFVFGPDADGICDVTGHRECACKYPCKPGQPGTIES
ncbi:unnamed protein product [Cochlearia groenlandica]